jgi:hypothetical protein
MERAHIIWHAHTGATTGEMRPDRARDQASDRVLERTSHDGERG